MAISEKQKRYALIGGGALILFYLLYRWYSNNQASNAATTASGVTAPNTTGTDYASLAGQEQGDVAALQAQEQSDVSGLQSGLSALGTQEATDVSGLTSTVGGITGQLQNLADMQSSLGNQIAGIAMGAQQVSPSTVATHKGGPFYNYYVKVTGHPPPATLQSSNFLYQAWKSGVKASALQASSRPHASAKNTHVKHPNGDHTPKTSVAHPNSSHTRAAPAPKRPSPPPRRPAPKPKPPPAKTKAKASGRRR